MEQRKNWLSRSFMIGALVAIFATGIYLPTSGAARQWRQFRARVLRKHSPFLQVTSLPQVSWKEATRPRFVHLTETGRSNGNIRLSELAILSHMAANCLRGTCILEIGTFDGRTALNLSNNAPSGTEVFTLDLPSAEESRFKLEKGERHMVQRGKDARRFEAADARGRITQLVGDSATFDFSPYYGRCGLVFVDGSHAYPYVMSDSEQAFRLAAPGGLVVWHDYGVWPGVTEGLEELEKRETLGLRAIRGTSLVVWRKPLDGARSAGAGSVLRT